MADPALPVHKGEPGWEFTPLPRGFDLDAYPAARGGSAEAEPMFTLDEVISLGDTTPDGVLVMPLSQAVSEHGALVEQHLGKVVANDENAFTARNAAQWEGGAFVYVPRDVKVDLPILLTSVLSEQDTALHWRLLVVLEDGAEASVWEQYLSTADGLFTTVVELVVGDNAKLRFVSGQALSEKSLIYGTQRARVARDASLDWVVLGFGGGNGKVFQNTILDGEGATGKVTGAYAMRGRQHLDFDTTQEHAAANCVSDLAFRGILTGRSSAVWRGMIKVDEGAQQTDAFQESRNLLLSKKAHADAIPGLEILANDVRCTHAAAIAQIDPNQLFYLRTHGLPLEQASRLVVEGFLAELVERFEEGPVREQLAAALEKRLAAVLD